MLILARVCMVIGVTTAIVVAAVVPSLAKDGWGSVDCDQIPSPTCDLEAGTEDGDSRGGQPQQGDRPRGGGSGEAEEPEQGDRIVGDPTNLADCEYVRSDYVPPDAVSTIVEASAPAGQSPRIEFAVLVLAPTRLAQPAPEGDEPGAWYVYQCSSEGFRDALWRPPIWIPDTEEPDGTAGPSVVDVAQQAYNQLRLGSPLIGVSPAADQLVHLSTWLWVEPDSWGDVSATASVPGVSVTATATPVSVSWSMGDGGIVTCDGPGTPFSEGADPASSSPDCGHTYTASSAGQPGDVFDVIATVQWTVTWSGAGNSGEFPGLTTEATTQVRVAESQALNTR